MNPSVLENGLKDKTGKVVVDSSQCKENGFGHKLTTKLSHSRITGTKDAHVLVIVTGGTIAMKNKNGVYVPERNYINEVIESTPVLHDRAAAPEYCTNHANSNAMGEIFVIPKLSLNERRVIYCMYEYENPLDSCNMTMANYKMIAMDIQSHYASYDGFVILHGTDTMAYTASYLSFMLENLGKSVVLTGAQVPLCATRSDAVDNLLGALLIAGNYTIPEVSLYFHHRLYRGNRVMKIDTESFHAFNSPNLEPLLRMGVEIAINWNIVWRTPSVKKFSLHLEMEEDVGLLRLFPGITASTVKAFLSPPIKGVVLQTYGAGNGPSNRKDILDEIRIALERDVLILNCTQCQHGRVTPSYETGQIMEEAGIVSGYDITPEAALAKLSYILGKSNTSHLEKRKLLVANLRGEVTKLEDKSDIIASDKFFDAVAAAMQLSSTSEREKLRVTLYPPLLCFAAMNNEVANLEKFEAQGADLCCPDYDGRTALHVAAAEGNAESVQYLLSKGASVYAQDRFGHTPLEDAIQFRRSECIALLRQAGAHLSISPETLGGTLCRLTSNNDVAGLKAWADAGADMTSCDYNARNALHVAAEKNFADVVNFLLQNKVDPHVKDKYGRSALDNANANIKVVMHDSSVKK